MTLLVLALELPKAESSVSDLYVIELLLKQFDLLYNYFLSFILLAFFWINHHNQFHYFQKTDDNHLWINIFLLMFVALVPFTTVIVGNYPLHGAADIVFAINIIFISLLSYLNFWYAKKRSYLIAGLPEHMNRRLQNRVLMVVGICILAIILALVFPPASSFSFLLIPILLIIPNFKT